MPSNAFYGAISGSYQLHLDEVRELINQIDLSKAQDEVKQLVAHFERLQKLTDVYRKAGE